MRIDLHADTPLWQTKLGYDFCRGHRAPLPAGAWLGNLDLPRMRAGGLDVQLFGLVALPWEGDGLAVIERMLRRLHEAAAASDGGLVLAADTVTLGRAHAAGARVGMLSIEGVHALRGDLRRAAWLVDQGVVSMGLTHFHRNEAACPAMGWGRDADAGLTAFGTELVQYLASRRVIVDLTHINRRGFFDALARAPGPVMVSHTGIQAAHPHWRNLDDAQVRAVAERGGIVGVIFSRHYLGGNDIGAVVRHLQQLVRLGGAECAALGSDFDGFIVPVRGLRDCTGLDALHEALCRAGLSAACVDGIMGGNARRFLGQALGQVAPPGLPSRA